MPQVKAKTMRLDKLEKHALDKAIENVAGQVYMFGSRVNEKAKGGDIDLLIFSQQDSLTLSLKVAREFTLLCDERIDVVVMDDQNLTPEQKAFLNTIDKQELIK
ncbi:MAG: putative nucleotidyltransferase [Phenylobacterium sp.]|jgi:predicted nucleotidyltransferase